MSFGFETTEPAALSSRRDVVTNGGAFSVAGRKFEDLPSVRRTRFVGFEAQKPVRAFTSVPGQCARRLHDPTESLYLFDPQFDAGDFQILGAKTALIEEFIAANSVRDRQRN